MPRFQKRALSLYLRNRCERQFVLYLYTDTERERHNMPIRQQRPGLGIVGDAGYEWQDEKISELRLIFGDQRVLEGPPGENRPLPIPLEEALLVVQPYQFIVEGNYAADTPTFRNAVGLSDLRDYYGDVVQIGETRPDIIQTLPSMVQGGVPDTDKRPNPYELGVSPDGSLIDLNNDDARTRLRVIDIKLTAEPGANYFAEVVYYSMTLAAWLIENGLSDRFVVVGAPAVWPGSHDASHLAEQRSEWLGVAHQPVDKELIDALEPDLELAIFDVFAPRLRSLLTQELPTLLSKSWNELDWHVDFRCKGCEFLSPDRRPDEDDERVDLRCYPTAERISALCRVNGLSRGASGQLQQNHVSNVSDLAATVPTSDIFNSHQGLKAKRTSFPFRAQALMDGTTSIIPDSGGDALMPKWPDLRIFIFLDYDLSSAITSSMAIRASWLEPIGAPEPRHSQLWTQRNGQDGIFVVDERTVDRERAEFIRFLQRLADIISAVRDQDDADYNAGRRANAERRSTYQIYLWDESQQKHLIRLISRHLPHILHNPSLRDLAWLFPPPEILQHAEDATRRSAITLVKTVVENTVALNMPHYYALLDLAERVTPERLSPPSVHPLYKELFSDLIPMERLHERWNHTANWLENHEQIIRATRAKVYALSLVADWLQRELRDVLTNASAPPITPPNRNMGRMSHMSKLWLGFTELNAALDGLDKHSIRAMPPHERVARFKSAHLLRRLDQGDRVQAIALLNTSDGVNLTDRRTLLIYELSPDSVDINIERREFLYALAPMDDHNFLDRKAVTLTHSTPFWNDRHYQQTIESARLTQISVEAIDRINRLIALTVDNVDFIRHLENTQQYDFSHDVMLDPIEGDFLTRKVQMSLRAIGHPPSAPTDPLTIQALGIRQVRQGRGSESPASEILWEAPRVHQQRTAITVATIRPQLERYLTENTQTLNPSQWDAWTHALEHRLSMIWGPPGTGKSRTLRSIVLGACLHAKEQNNPLRVLISANTYTAIDNVVVELEEDLRKLLGSDHYLLARVQSTLREPPPASWTDDYPSLNNIIFDRFNPSVDAQDLIESLNQPESIIIVGAHPHQLHNMAVGRGSGDDYRLTMRDWFDMIVIDEASQLDVASSTLVFTKRAADGSCIIAGDDLQLSPIHQAEPPENLEHVVQSLYDYFRRFHGIEPSALDVNYRSNQTIVEFSKTAGYSERLHSYSPGLKLHLITPIPVAQPDDWPESLAWTPEWKALLDPDYPAVSFLYRDTLSAQVNDFEADSVVALTWLLRTTMSGGLQNEIAADGSVRQVTSVCYSAEQFWQRAVGIITPHRAQRSRVITQLRDYFPDDLANDIFGAVDTVERYQGQQRDVIIASFAIGDPDMVEAEDEFLYNLNRFNVLASRARAKVIVFCTTSLLEHLSNDIDVLEESRLLKGYVDAFCTDPHPINIGYIRQGEYVERNGILRRRGFATPSE